MPLKIIPDVVQNQTIHSLQESSTAQEAAREMIDNNVSAVVVVDKNEKLAGIVTERDMTRRVVAECLDPASVVLKEIMTAKPETLAPDDLAHEALSRMLKRGFRHLPVVEDGHVVGMVSMRNLQQAIATYSSKLGL
ncbi:MAG: CBS domain-containing protein [Gammaproteobacteria bacterium]|nr:CBS domain-containing protein [Gammaproteobacteria bacterium]